MLRQERFGAGMADQKETDSELARAIMSDGKFQVRGVCMHFRFSAKDNCTQNDLEYMDDNAEKLGRKKMRTDAMKRQFAINGTSFGAVC
jgi:tRNA U34 2-thiouridine synthase MnmA/TrmU